MSPVGYDEALVETIGPNSFYCPLKFDKSLTIAELKGIIRLLDDELDVSVDLGTINFGMDCMYIDAEVTFSDRDGAWRRLEDGINAIRGVSIDHETILTVWNEIENESSVKVVPE